MLNSNQWQQRHSDFMLRSRDLMQRCEDCIAHLELIAADDDAVDCLQATLRSLSDTATDVAPGTITDFAGQLQRQLDTMDAASLNQEALQTLRHCLSLLAWQLELIDPDTGELPMDDDEQCQLLGRLASLAAPGSDKPAP